MAPKLTLPPRLRSGARIALIAPSGPVPAPDARRAARRCAAMGLQGVLFPNAGRALGYLAGTDDERLSDLNTALTDRTIDAVWALRGGDGMNRILDRVDFEGFAACPKPVIGYSDLTALLVALQALTGVVTFHGPIARSPMSRFVRRHFDGVMTAAKSSYALENVPGSVLHMVVGGRAHGPLIGGNLTLLQALIGTRYAPDFAGAILMIEDVNEPVHRIDRMLGHLRLAGALSQLAGVAIGHFTRVRERAVTGISIDDVLRHYFAPLAIPVVRGFPIGHVREQWTVPIGVDATLDAGTRTLVLNGPAVR